MQLRSDAVRCGTPRAPHRSLLKADGLTDEEMKRPLVAVFNSRNDIIPGHNNLDKICEAVKAGIYMAGGVPFEISTIGVCDGIAMNHDGMHYSLVSREAIADSFECAIQGHAFDAAVCIPNCDKIVPGMLLGALRVNIPTVFVSGGPMLPGHQPGCTAGPTTDLNTLFDGAGQVAAGTMTEEQLKYYEDTACPTCGSCSGMFTANSMNCLCEALGIALPGNGTIARIEDGVQITGDLAGGAITLHVSDEELAARRAAFVPPAPKHNHGVLAKYAKLVSSADKGAYVS